MRDILDLAEDVEIGSADPEHVASKAEELLKFLESFPHFVMLRLKIKGKTRSLPAQMLRQRAKCRTKCLKLARRC